MRGPRVYLTISRKEKTPARPSILHIKQDAPGIHYIHAQCTRSIHAQMQHHLSLFPFPIFLFLIFCLSQKLVPKPTIVPSMSSNYLTARCTPSGLTVIVLCKLSVRILDPSLPSLPLPLLTCVLGGCGITAKFLGLCSGEFGVLIAIS